MINKYVLFFSLMIYGMLFSQSADLRLVEVQNDGANYDLKLQIQGSAAFALGSSNLKFNFSTADLSVPTLLISHNFDNAPFYSEITVTEPKAGIASVNIELFAPNFGTTVNTSWMDVATVRFSIVGSSASSSLTWRNMNPPETDNPTVIFLDDESTQVSQGAFTGLNTSPLPVELTSFSVSSVKNNSVQLNWETATEVNNYGFEIERANNGGKLETKKWSKIGFAQGHGNSNSKKEYSFDDKSPPSGKVFYRLKQIDVDGSFEYSEIIQIVIDLPEKFELFQNYPNPFSKGTGNNQTTTIEFTLPKSGFVKLRVYNILGELVATLLNEQMEAGFKTVPFNAEDIPSGIYLYNLSTKDLTATKKMILLR